MLRRFEGDVRLRKFRALVGEEIFEREDLQFKVFKDTENVIKTSPNIYSGLDRS